MSQQIVTKCDGKGCEKVKGEANKWIEAWVRYHHASSSDYNPQPVLISIGFDRGDLKTDGDDDDYRKEDFCSEVCLQKRIGEVINAIRAVHAEENPRKPLPYCGSRRNDTGVHVKHYVPVAQGAGRIQCPCGWTSSVQLEEQTTPDIDSEFDTHAKFVKQVLGVLDK